MVDTEKLDLLASVSSLASNKLADELAGNLQDPSSAVEPPVFKQEAPEHESLGGSKVDGKEDHATEALRRKLAMFNIKHSLQINCDAKPVVKSSPDSQLDSPASKGYSITGLFHANIFLGRRKYFIVSVASQNGNLEEQVFSISMDKIILSRVQGDTYSEHPLLPNESHNSPSVWFDIGSKRYCWNTEEHKVNICPVQDGCLSTTHEPSSVSLHDSIDEAQMWYELIDGYYLDTSAANPVVSNNGGFQPHEQLEGVDGSGVSDKPGIERQTHEPLRFSFTGYEQNSRPILVSPSPPNNTLPLAGVLPITSEEERPLFFGAGAQKNIIDTWVDKKAAADRGSNPGGGMGCPEHACPHSSRRPHALKDHLYSHYCIKPFECYFASCEFASSTLANMKRHYKNVHVCKGCKVVGSAEDTKRHKKTCVRLLALKDSAKKGKKGPHS